MLVVPVCPQVAPLLVQTLLLVVTIELRIFLRNFLPNKTLPHLNVLVSALDRAVNLILANSPVRLYVLQALTPLYLELCELTLLPINFLNHPFHALLSQLLVLLYCGLN